MATLLELSQTCEDAHTSFQSAKSRALASQAQADADHTAAVAAKEALTKAAGDVVAAAQAEGAEAL